MNGTQKMEIVSMIQEPDDIFVGRDFIQGTDREVYEAVKASALQIAKDLELFNDCKATVEMCQNTPYAQVWMEGLILAKVEAVAAEVS